MESFDYTRDPPISSLTHWLKWATQVCMYVVFGLFVNRISEAGIAFAILVLCTCWVILKTSEHVVSNSKMPRWARFLWLPGILDIRNRSAAGILGFNKGEETELQRRLLVDGNMRVTAHNFHRHKAKNVLPMDVILFRSDEDVAHSSCVRQRKLRDRFGSKIRLPPLTTIPERSLPDTNKSDFDRRVPPPNNSPDHPLFTSDF